MWCGEGLKLGGVTQPTTRHACMRLVERASRAVVASNGEHAKGWAEVVQGLSCSAVYEGRMVDSSVVKAQTCCKPRVVLRN